MSSKIIDFYKKANASKLGKVVNKDSILSPLGEDITVSVDKKIKQDNLEPLDNFFQTLVETLKKEKENSKIVEDLTQDTIKQATLSFIDKLKESEQENTISTEPVLLEDKIKQATLGFINQLKESDDVVVNKTEKLPEKFTNKLTKASEKKEEKINEETETNSVKKEEKEIVSTPVKKQENTYVAQLKSEDKIHKNQTKLEKISDIKGFVTQQIKEEINKFRQQYPNLGFGSSGGGGGTNAVQYADGGVMNGDLTVNGRYLSGGVDVAEFFSKPQGDRLIAGNKNLILNTDGTVSFPDQTIAAPQEEMLTISSSNTSVNAFTKIVLSPYGFFVYDENSNSITFDTVDNDIVLTTLDNNEWKFDSEGVLTGPNGTLVVKDFNSIGKILSGGRDLTDIFLTTETDSQTLSFNLNTKDLSISNGNVVSLSSLVDNETYFSQASSKYENLITLVQSNSANWAIDNSTDSGLRSLSGNWQQTYTLVQSNSANWNLITISDPTKFNFIGDGSTVTYNVSGTNKSSNPAYIEVFVENVRQEPVISYTLSSDKVTFLQAPELDTSIVIITPNTKLFNSTTNEYVIPYYTSETPTNSTPSSPQTLSFNLNTKDLSISNGNTISLSSLVDSETYFSQASSKYENVTTVVQSNSANWNYQGTDIKALTGNWNSAYLDTIVLNQQVSDIQLDIIALDGSITNTTNVTNFNSTLLNSNSANWNSTYTTVQSNSANWDYQGTDIKALTGNWDLTYNTVQNNSSNWNSAYNKVNNLTIADVSNLQASLTGKQDKGNYPLLDNDNKIPSVYLPSYVDDIVEYSSFSTLPNTGESSKIYTTLNDSKIYRWSGTQYVEIVSSIGSTDSLVEGSVNKYFTNQRAASAAPVQSVAGRTGNVVLGISDITNLNTQLTATNVTTSTFQVKAVSQGIYNDGATIPAGTSLETIIRNMLITRVLPTYNAPLLSVAYGSPSISTTYEVGFTIPTFTINPTYTPRDGGSLVGYAYLRNGSTLGNGSTFTVNSFQINSTTTLQVSARYGDGPIYNDNLGDPYPDTSIKANSVINTLTINTLYPYFYGKSSTQPTAASIAASIQAGTATKVLADANGTVSISYNANGEFIWFAHIGTTKTKWYFTELNSGNIGNGNFINTPVTQNVTSPENYWTSVQYKIYISSGQTSTTGALQFRNS